MRKLINKVAIAAVVTTVISGCAGYDQWAENTNRSMNVGWTEMLYGKQTVDNTALPKGMLVNIKYGKNMLTFNVNMFNDAGGLVRTEPVFIAPYMAGVKASINKDVMADPQMQKSNQVTHLVLSNARCT